MLGKPAQAMKLLAQLEWGARWIQFWS